MKIFSGVSGGGDIGLGELAQSRGADRAGAGHARWTNFRRKPPAQTRIFRRKGSSRAPPKLSLASLQSQLGELADILKKCAHGRDPVADVDE